MKLVAFTLALVLVGCQTTPDFNHIATQLPKLDEKVEKGCVDPLLLPVKGLSQQEVEKYWASDRAALVQCSGQESTTRFLYNSARAGLIGEELPTLMRP